MNDDAELLEAEVHGYRVREVHLLLLELASTVDQAETAELVPVLTLLRGAVAELFTTEAGSERVIAGLGLIRTPEHHARVLAAYEATCRVERRLEEARARLAREARTATVTWPSHRDGPFNNLGAEAPDGDTDSDDVN